MNKIAVIGGSHFASLQNLDITHSTTVKTPFGDPSAPLSYGILGDQEVVYLPRRGAAHPMPPHEINYRANIWALRDAGVQTIIATAAVAGLIGRCTIGDIIIPDQLIDYTYGRENTFLGPEVPVKHVDFAQPYSESLRQKIITKAKLLQFPLIPQATYGITQGPRLETLAELKRYAQDTCDFVGMTGMPEAALARELELDYACIALVVREGGKPYESKDPDRLQINDERIEKLIEAIIRSAQP